MLKTLHNRWKRTETSNTPDSQEKKLTPKGYRKQTTNNLNAAELRLIDHQKQLGEDYKRWQAHLANMRQQILESTRRSNTRITGSRTDSSTVQPKSPKDLHTESKTILKLLESKDITAIKNYLPQQTSALPPESSSAEGPSHLPDDTVTSSAGEPGGKTSDRPTSSEDNTKPPEPSSAEGPSLGASGQTSDHPTSLEVDTEAKNSFQNLFTTTVEKSQEGNRFFVRSSNLSDGGKHEHMINVDKGEITEITNIEGDFPPLTVVREQVRLVLAQAGKDTFDLTTWRDRDVDDEEIKSVVSELVEQQPGQRSLTLKSGSDGFNKIKNTRMAQSRFERVASFSEREVTYISVLLKGEGKPDSDIDISYHTLPLEAQESTSQRQKALADVQSLKNFLPGEKSVEPGQEVKARLDQPTVDHDYMNVERTKKALAAYDQYIREVSERMQQITSLPEFRTLKGSGYCIVQENSHKEQFEILRSAVHKFSDQLTSLEPLRSEFRRVYPSLHNDNILRDPNICQGNVDLLDHPKIALFMVKHPEVIKAILENFWPFSKVADDAPPVSHYEPQPIKQQRLTVSDSSYQPQPTDLSTKQQGPLMQELTQNFTRTFGDNIHPEPVQHPDTEFISKIVANHPEVADHPDLEAVCKYTALHPDAAQFVVDRHNDLEKLVKPLVDHVEKNIKQHIVATGENLDADQLTQSILDHSELARQIAYNHQFATEVESTIPNMQAMEENESINQQMRQQRGVNRGHDNLYVAGLDWLAREILDPDPKKRDVVKYILAHPDVVEHINPLGAIEKQGIDVKSEVIKMEQRQRDLRNALSLVSDPAA